MRHKPQPLTNRQPKELTVWGDIIMPLTLLVLLIFSEQIARVLAGWLA